MDALAKPPPPHVTLYTSQPAGLAGIGLNTVAELDAALRLAATPTAPPGLRAYEMQASVIRGT